MNDPIPADHPLVAADRRHMIHPLHFAKNHTNPKILALMAFIVDMGRIRSLQR